MVVSLWSGALGRPRGPGFLESLAPSPSEGFMADLRQALVSNDFSRFKNQNISVKTAAFLKMLELKQKTVGPQVEDGGSGDEPLDTIHKRLAVASAFLEEMTALALFYYAPKFDLAELRELLLEFEVRLTSETLAHFLPKLPRNSIPKITFNVDTNARPKWDLHSCRDANDRSRSCIRLRLAINVNGNTFIGWAAIEFYFRNTNNFVRPMISGFFLEKSEVPYDETFFNFKNLVHFGEGSLELAKGGINYTLSQIYRGYLQTLEAFCKRLRVNQEGEHYVIDLELWV